ncbi:MAG: hypothetical protein ACRDBY_04955 [Cetobacterium sp.]
MIKERINQASSIIERDLLWGLCKDYGNYNKIRRYIDVNDFSTEEFRDTFLSIKSLYDNSGFKNITESTVKSYCLDKGKSDESSIRLQSFVEMAKEIEIDFEGTYNQFIRTTGMSKWLKKADEFGGIENMVFNIYNKTENAEELRNELDNINKQCFKSYKKATRIVDMSKGMAEYVKDRMFSEANSGVKFMHMPLLQSYVKGIHVGLTGIASYSGFGKSTWAITKFAIPLLEQKQKLLSIHNEQEEDEIRQLYLMAYISMVAKNEKKLHRNYMNYMNKGKITDEQMNYLIKCAEDFEKRYDGLLTFVFVPRFNEDDLEGIILDYKRLGHDHILLDTVKLEDATQGWQGLDNLMNRLDGISKENKLKIVYTAQLAQHMSWRKYLDADCIGKAKSLKDTATELYLFRKILQDEIPTIKCSYWNKDKEWIDGITLDPEKNYIAWFVNKTRHGEDDKIIIYQYDMGFQYMREIGVTNSIKNDKVGGK